MGEGLCKGTKGWIFNKMSIYKQTFYPPKKSEGANQKKLGALQYLWLGGNTKTVWVNLSNSLSDKV